MMLFIWHLCGKDFFNIGIYRFKQKFISLYVLPCMQNPASPHACNWYYRDPWWPPDGCSNVQTVYWSLPSTMREFYYGLPALFQCWEKRSTCNANIISCFLFTQIQHDLHKKGSLTLFPLLFFSWDNCSEWCNMCVSGPTLSGLIFFTDAVTIFLTAITSCLSATASQDILLNFFWGDILGIWSSSSSSLLEISMLCWRLYGLGAIGMSGRSGRSLSSSGSRPIWGKKKKEMQVPLTHWR